MCYGSGMQVHVLQCARCGGSLTRPPAIPALIDCVFCGSVIAVSTGAPVMSRHADAVEVREARRQQFHDALVAALQAGTAPELAVRDAAATHLELGAQAAVAARIAIVLARDIEHEEQVEAVNQPIVLGRIVHAYVAALDTLRTAERAELNLPFLAANASGPKHLRRTVTAQQLIELSQRDPDAPRPTPAAEAPAPAPAPVDAPAKKRWWWPFG